MYSDKQIKDIFFDLEKHPQLFDFQFRGFSMYFMVRFFFEAELRKSVIEQNGEKLEQKKDIIIIEKKIAQSYFIKLAYKYRKNLLSKFIIAIDWRLANRREQKQKLASIKEKQELIKHFDSPQSIPSTPFLFVSTSGLMTKDNMSMEMPDIMQYFHKKQYPIVFLQGYFGIKTRKMPFYDKFILLEDNDDEIEKITQTEKLHINQFVVFLRNHFNLPFDNLENIFATTFMYQYGRAKNLSFYIGKTKCSYIFARSIYSDPWVIMACAMNKIKCVEVQHGVVTHNSIYYQSSLSIEKLNINTLLMPEYILTFGEIWKNIFIEQKYLYNSKNTFNIGHYDYKKYLETDNQSKNINEFTILVAGQVSIFDISEELKQFIDEYSQNLNENNIKIIIRPHPLHLNTIIESIQTKYNHILELQDSKIISIFEAIKNADVVISATSNCLYEALAMGKPAISFARFEGQILTEHILLAKDAKDLWDLLIKIKNNLISITPQSYINSLDTSVLDFFIQNKY